MTRRSRTRSRLRSQTLVVIAIVLTVGLVGCGGANEPDTTVVPVVRDASISSAFSTIRKAGLRVEIEEPFVMDALRDGPYVHAQDPRAGTVMTTNPVVTIGRIRFGSAASTEGFTPTPNAIVPDFVRRPVADAVAWAEENLLFWKASFPPLLASDAPTLLEAYLVRAQTPAPGTRLFRSVSTPLELRATRARQRE